MWASMSESAIADLHVVEADALDEVYVAVLTLGTLAPPVTS